MEELIVFILNIKGIFYIILNIFPSLIINLFIQKNFILLFITILVLIIINTYFDIKKE